MQIVCRGAKSHRENLHYTRENFDSHHGTKEMLNHEHVTGFLLLAFIMASCNTQPQNAVSNVDTSICPEVVASALSAVDEVCSGTSANQICFGNIDLTIEAQPGAGELIMEQPGDMVDFADVLRLELSPMDTASASWGVALMRLQALIPGVLPGQLVTFLLFGNVQIDNEGRASADGPQAFRFESGLGDAPCEGAPDSGMLVQTPAGAASVTFVINGVEIALGSTVYLQAQPSNTLSVSVIEGRAAVSAQNVTQTVVAGNVTRIELDAEGLATSPPSPPEPYGGASLVSLPIQSLERAVPLVNVALRSVFVENAEGWGFFNDATDFAYYPADSTSDGYICATDLSTGVYWYFEAPEFWLGDQSDAYGGVLSYVIRQSATDSPGEAPDILLIGEDNGLQYDTTYDPDVVWTGYSIPLVESAGWVLLDAEGNIVSAEPAAAEIQAVLASLTAIRIRAHHITVPGSSEERRGGRESRSRAAPRKE